jgi:hypothetical protein
MRRLILSVVCVAAFAGACAASREELMPPREGDLNGRWLGDGTLGAFVWDLRPDGEWTLSPDSAVSTSLLGHGTWKWESDRLVLTEDRGACAAESQRAALVVLGDRNRWRVTAAEDACQARRALLPQEWTRLNEPERPPTTGARVSLLFVGNSYTFANDLPGMVAAILRTRKISADVHAVVRYGATLTDHWAGGFGDAPSRIESGHWSWVILQEQSTRPLREPGAFASAVAGFARQAAPRGTQIAVLETWAQQAHPEEQPALASATRVAAQAAGARVIPAGEAWALAQQGDSSSPLWAADGDHPSAWGTYLTAAATVDALFGPGLLPARIERHGKAVLSLTPSGAVEAEHMAEQALAGTR